jgi:hypothetical protein
MDSQPTPRKCLHAPFALQLGLVALACDARHLELRERQLSRMGVSKRSERGGGGVQAALRNSVLSPQLVLHQPALGHQRCRLGLLEGLTALHLRAERGDGLPQPAAIILRKNKVSKGFVAREACGLGFIQGPRFLVFGTLRRTPRSSQ